MGELRDWFLTPDERDNPATDIDRRRGDGRAWTEGNDLRALIHGDEYFSRLWEVLSRLRRGDLVHFADWRGDPNELLDGPGTPVGEALAALARRGVSVRGLVWRSHPDQADFSEQENLALGEVVNEAGGEVLLDERVRRAGCHHQKLFVVRHLGRQDDDVAFVGGIDLCRGRRDGAAHEGDPQAIDIDPRYGPRPPWHDIQMEIRGPAVGDVDTTFRERWEDPTPLDHRNPWRGLLARLAREPRHVSPLPPMPVDPAPAGRLAVQILRTYPRKRPPFPYAPEGERSVARAYAKALARASSLIYLEDQYLWSREVAALLAMALRRSPQLRLIAVVPRYPDRDGRLSGPPNRIGQEAAIREVREAGGDRVGIYDLENELGWPIYVHAKVCVIDDVWVAVGSDNLNRRSWTHDSELSCAVVDREPDDRAPVDPGGLGDGARAFARELRLRLWREHLGPEPLESALLDPVEGFQAWGRSAQALDEWHRRGKEGPRPSGRIRSHRPAPVGRLAWMWAGPFYRMVVDPDGRPRRLKRADRF